MKAIRSGQERLTFDASSCVPVRADDTVLKNRQAKLDRLYVAVDSALKKLAEHLGVAA